MAATTAEGYNMYQFMNGIGTFTLLTSTPAPHLHATMVMSWHSPSSNHVLIGALVLGIF